MAETPHDLGEVHEVDVQAIGEPGHRTFRLLVQGGITTASLWIEKEQLEQLALIVDQQLARSSHTRPIARQPNLTFAERFPAEPTLDFKVGRLALGFDPEKRRFLLTAEGVDEGAPIVSFLLSQALAEALGSKIVAVAAAGRPRCPLCGAPIEGKHLCPLSNGHVA